MMFGLEAEKFLFTEKRNTTAENIFNLLEMLPQNEAQGPLERGEITSEFVLNMVEMNTAPSSSLMGVIADYYAKYCQFDEIASQQDVSLVPLGALPTGRIPSMTPKWGYFVQNSVLRGQQEGSWTLGEDSPLMDAGNCAGVHVHAEIDTPPQFLYSNDELKNKFNMGLMMTPMTAFSSSPYFYGMHEAHCMRGQKYFGEVYRNLPLQGALPPVMNSSQQVLTFVRDSLEDWLKRATNAGFERSEIEALTKVKGANWNPLRWNSRWNTIEVRCLDSDYFEMDAAKFLWIARAMTRLDLKGEALQCRVIPSERTLDQNMISEAFTVSGKEVSILPTHAINELFHRSIQFGLQDDLVESYLQRLAMFASAHLLDEERPLFEYLWDILNERKSTSDSILEKCSGRQRISDEQGQAVIRHTIREQKRRMREEVSLLRPTKIELDSRRSLDV